MSENQHLKTEVQNCAFFGDLSTATTKYLRLWRPASAFKIHSKGCKSNGEALWLCYCLFFLSTYWFSDIFGPLKKLFLRWDTLYNLTLSTTEAFQSWIPDTFRHFLMKKMWMADGAFSAQLEGFFLLRRWLRKKLSNFFPVQ